MILPRSFNLRAMVKTVVVSLPLLVFYCYPMIAETFHDNDIHSMFRFSHLSAANGLASQRVFSIIEGSDHAIWIATKNGIERYNGMSMQQYNIDLNVKNYSELTSRILRLYKSSTGKLYAFTNTGKIFRYDIISNSFVSCCDLTKLFSQEIILNDISIVGNKYWLALNIGFYRYQQGSKPMAIIRNSFANDLSETKDGIYIGTNNGLYYTDFARQKVRFLLPNLQVLSSYYDNFHHKLWVGTFNNGLLLADINTKKLYLQYTNSPHKPVRAITPFNKQTMLIGVDGGGVVGLSRLTGKQQFILSTDDELGAVLSGNGIYDVCCDEWGNIWIGSYSGGVDVAYAVDNALKVISHEYLNSQSLFNNNVNDIMDDGHGNIYYATDRGVSTYYSASDTWKHTMTDMVCLNFAHDINGRILVATYGGGVRSIDGNAVYTKENGKLKTDYIFSLYNDAYGNLWVGCLDGDLACISASGQHFFPIQNVQSIASMPDKRVAIATANGFYAIDSNGQMAHYFTAGEFPSSDVNVYIMSMLFTSENEVWLGTDGGGIYIYNLRLHSYRQLTTKDGLPSNSVKGITRDRLGRFWVTTDHGMVYVVNNSKTKIVAVDLPHSGGLEFNRNAMAMLSNGKMAFGSTSGALIVKPDAVMATHYKAPIQLRDIIISGLDREEASKLRPHVYDMLKCGNIVLPYSQNTFTLTFESINLKYQYDIDYQYYIEGQHDNATQTVSDGRILFNSLSPGLYRIHLRSISRSTGQIISERILNIRIKQPWWNSFFAWLIYACIIVAVIYFVWRIYRNRLQREYDTERINFFVNTAHDIRTPLSLTLAPLEDIAHDNTLSNESRNYLEIALRNGKQLMTLITTLLDFQKVDTRKIQLHIKQLNLHYLLEQACSRFLLLSQQKRITLSLTSCPDEATVWMDERAANRILDNLISNAIKYTRENGKVEVGAKVDTSHIIIFVRDNGIGIPEKAQQKIFSAFYRAENAVRFNIGGSGLGLMLINKLVALHHGTVSFSSQENKGTTFFVTLPKGFSMQMDNMNYLETTDSTENPKHSTLLFVDDNAELRNYMKLVFGKEYNVVTKHDAQSALDYLSANSCDIIISDVMMPGMQGDEFCQKVKTNELTSFIPIILLTANVDRNNAIDGLNSGADDYISKPFDAAVLQAKVASILRNRKTLQEYYLHHATDLVHKTSEEYKPITTKQEAEKPERIKLNEADKNFIDKATRTVMENMHDEAFDINGLCREMAMSRTLFYSKLKALTGQAPQEFIRILRLERAAKLLDEGETVFEASTDTGFTNTKYFSTLFKKHFGVSPSKYHK